MATKTNSSKAKGKKMPMDDPDQEMPMKKGPNAPQKGKPTKKAPAKGKPTKKAPAKGK